MQLHDEELDLPKEERLFMARDILKEPHLLIYRDSPAGTTYGVATLGGTFGLFVMLSYGRRRGKAWVSSSNLAIRPLNIKAPLANELNTGDDMNWPHKRYSMTGKSVLHGLSFRPESRRFVEELKSQGLENILLENRMVPDEPGSMTMRLVLELFHEEFTQALAALTSVQITRLVQEFS